MWEYNYICHHGIKGQRWGVRRYQNYDGSYTQAGIRRYRESSDLYNKANERYKNAKKSGDKKEISLAKGARARARNQVNADYRQLKLDYRADKGRKKAAEGRTVLGGRISTAARAGILTSLGTRLVSAAKKEYLAGGKAATVNILSAIGGLSYASAIAVTAENAVTTSQIRAYYHHSRPPRRN